MYRHRDNTNHMTPTAPDLGEHQNHHNSKRRWRGPRRYCGKGSKHHHQNRPRAYKPEYNYGYRDSFNMPQWSPRLPEAPRLALRPRTFDELHAERQSFLNALQAQDSWALEKFRELSVVEADIDHWQNVQHRQQHAYQQHDRYRVNTKVEVKVDGVPVSEINDQARKEEAEETQKNQEKLQAAYRQRLWLRQEIEATVDRERDILMRLGELHVETRCRERLCQVERERLEMLHASRPGYNRFPPNYTPYQQWPWHQNPDQNMLSHPHMYLHQPSSHDDVDARHSQELSLSLSDLDFRDSSILSRHDCRYQNHFQHPPSGAQDCELPNEHADGGRGMGRRASDQAGRGQEDYMVEMDRKWTSDDMGDGSWQSWLSLPKVPSNMRRWSFS